ncbi:putative conserved hypothetical protein [Diplodia seriata]|uniref:Apple domain-containing protein n=1 Tax=Diplodia seriata TaxID=420778 RepID=A0A0G2FMW0_9PEZI|nr:putative conserved hypothetical protein [Diplodia seriata]
MLFLSLLVSVAFAAAAVHKSKRADVTVSSYLSAASSMCSKNSWDCCPLTSGPVAAPTPDTADAFVANPSFASLAANAPTPTGYTNAFTNAKGSIQQSFGYRGNTQLNSYDPEECAAFCNLDDYCRGFNLFVQRDPTLRPAYSVCTDPPSTGSYGCTRWGYPINVANATNDGSWQASFRVAVVASNGYNRMHDKVPTKTVPGFATPVNIDDAAIQDDSYYLFVDHEDQSTFDPAICAKDCQDNTAYNKLHSGGGSYTTCNMFNAYIPLKNGIAQGTRCALYSQPVSNISQKATNTGGTQGDDVYTIGESYVYVLNSS